MGLSHWLCVFWLQASLLLYAVDCSGMAQGEVHAGLQTADGQHNDEKQQRALSLTVGASEQEQVFLRRKRQLEHRGPTHMRHSSLPGTVTAKGSPNTLIQTDNRARRHLVPTGSKKKSKRKSRVGSFSLLSNNKPSTPLQLTRGRRQVKIEQPQRGKTNRSGAFSVLGDPQTEGQTTEKSSPTK
ncbi:uncharacterized protein si:dkey-12l12.1 [Thalassophryne amazonica]|uniref:uncharacterized protein si:dkey-12l12.1 n=1 Tax=Thalassophryne amazonica TaxID=390379 RepID=UPI001471E29F|nr:uncharacterized protein si:dkey-12l12.1 [Thalassophryne amazonica]